MRAAWYEKNGPAAEVLNVGDLPTPEPAEGEVLVRLHASAVNPSDVKARAGSRPIRWPKLIPNSDGAGVVGHYAIQLAKWAGATVVTTVSSDAKAAHARTAGADVVINYRTEDVAARVNAAVGGVDRIVDVDFGRNLPVSAQVLRDDGVIACYASTSIPRPQYPYPELLWRNPVVRQVFVYTMPDEAKAQAQSDIARWLNEAKPVFSIAHRFPLDQVVQAHLAVERGEKIGHVILDID